MSLPDRFIAVQQRDTAWFWRRAFVVTIEALVPNLWGALALAVAFRLCLA